MYSEHSTLNLPLLERLVGGTDVAAVVRSFIPPDLAFRIGERILCGGFSRYINAPSIGRIGMAFYETERRPALVEKYFDEALRGIRELRARCAPYLSPMDMLRCMLDELWPAGAHLATLYGRKMHVGLSRVVEPGVHFLAHHDIFAKDAPDTQEAHSLRAQLACNVYLQMPERGGALQIWDRLMTPADFDARRGDCYGIHPDLLGRPDVELRPQAGDLILFDSTKMHAVTPGQPQPRLSLSCFIGYRDRASPLVFWS
ncbi:2OG-Fe(II) oxygenase [Acidihalobacter prosperus]|uniref:Hydrogenase maturation factor n=1 Tax=Acidihalobacter prosperus TaxID=160660 RepID=A0A1A6C3Z8_9GAMM|nr:2OG-Fe(II) oxygenase [Acidihalobacter prosperus]OBS09279.1 Hydrogenase maturation factor [Acidihalobacter prosperus]